MITGATSGIGEATARLFVHEGASVVLCGRSEERGLHIAGSLGEHARFMQADVMREKDIAASVDYALQEFGRLDCMFNNAGAMVRGSLATITEEEFDAATRLLIGSVVFGIKHAARAMGPRGGTIINNSSIAAHGTYHGGYIYSIAKAAVSHATRIAAVKLGPRRIRVNSISPGAIATPIVWGSLSARPALDPTEVATRMAEAERVLATATPVPRAGLGDDIAHAALYLASEEGSYVNGHDLVVDGGRIWSPERMQPKQ